MLGDRRRGPLGVLERRRAEVDASAAGVEGGRERVLVADATAQLDPQVEATDDLGEKLAVAPFAEGRVEVDEVDPLDGSSQF